MKLKDLLKGRDKLREYDELKDLCDKIDDGSVVVFKSKIQGAVMTPSMIEGMAVSDHIKQIIIDAIDAEIKKIEEE